MSNLWIAEYVNPRKKNRVEKEIFYRPSKNDVRNHLIKNKGFMPVCIKPYKVKDKNNGTNAVQAANLLNSLQFASTGTSPVGALHFVIDNETNPKKRAEMLPAKKVLDSAGTMTEALKALKWYPSDVLSIIDAGEQTSNIRMAAQYANERFSALSKRARQNRVLAFVLGAEIFGILMTKATFGNMFQQLIGMLGIRAPDAAAQQKFDNTIANVLLINNILLYLMIGFIMLVAFFGPLIYQCRHDPYHWSTRMFNRLPGWRGYVEDLDIASGFRVIHTLLGNSTEKKRKAISDVIKIAKESAKTEEIRKYWDTVNSRLGYNTPGEAFCVKPLTREEQSKIRTMTTIEHLAAIAKEITSWREINSEEKYKKLRKRMFLAYITYEALSMLILMGGLYVLLEGARLTNESIQKQLGFQ